MKGTKIILNSDEEALIEIVEYVSKKSRKQLRSSYRGVEVAVPRSILGYMLREEGITIKRVGEIINRHHASILKYSKDHEHNMSFNQDYKAMYLAIQDEYVSGYRGAKVDKIQEQIDELQTSIAKIKRNMLKANGESEKFRKKQNINQNNK